MQFFYRKKKEGANCRSRNCEANSEESTQRKRAHLRLPLPWRPRWGDLLARLASHLCSLLAICFASPPFASRAPRFAGISWLERSLQAWHGLCHSSSSYSSMHATCRSRKALARRARSASVRICGSPYRGGHDGVISSLVLPRTFALSSLFASHLLPSLRALLDSPSFAPRCPRFVTFVLLASLRGSHPDGVCLRRACFSVSSSTDGTPVCPCGCAGACGRIWCASNRRCVWLVCVDESVHL